MARYRVLIEKTLEDGKVITLVDSNDDPPWYVAPMLREVARKIHESPPPVVLAGQAELEVA